MLLFRRQIRSSVPSLAYFTKHVSDFDTVNSCSNVAIRNHVDIITTLSIASNNQRT